MAVAIWSLLFAGFRGFLAQRSATYLRGYKKKQSFLYSAIATI